jgi:hypothetical protein
MAKQGMGYGAMCPNLITDLGVIDIWIASYIWLFDLYKLRLWIKANADGNFKIFRKKILKILDTSKTTM